MLPTWALTLCICSVYRLMRYTDYLDLRGWCPNHFKTFYLLVYISDEKEITNILKKQNKNKQTVCNVNCVVHTCTWLYLWFMFTWSLDHSQGRFILILSILSQILQFIDLINAHTSFLMMKLNCILLDIVHHTMLNASHFCH